MMEIGAEAIGYLAGAIVSCAALPRVFDIARDETKAAGESLPRNAMIVTGNALWVSYGLFKGAPAVTAMCAVGVLFNGIILYRVAVYAIRQNRAASGLKAKT